ICTSTHMKIEEDTILSGSLEEILKSIKENGYCMAGTRVDSLKMGPLDKNLYLSLCDMVDEVLIEADGSKRLPLKVCNENEPVIYENVDEIVLVAGLRALYKPLKEVCHRYNLLEMDENTIVTPEVFQSIYSKYKNDLKTKYPAKKITSKICQTSSLFEQVIASLIEHDVDVNVVNESWFDINKHLYIFGAGHVGYALSQLASYLEYHVHIMDERQDLLDSLNLSHVDEVICDSYSNLEKHILPDCYYAIMTPKHDNDYECLRALIDKPYRYLGMIGSKKKVALEFNRLRAEGISEELIQKVHSPIGLKIGSQSPKEIAVSIMAEIIQIKNAESLSSISTHLYESNEEGVLCSLVKKEASSPRNVGAMMLVTKDSFIDTIGGGSAEFNAIQDARNCTDIMRKSYNLIDGNIGVCGGIQTVLFIPIKKQNAM
ncbi:MAG: putative selenium-dependent hydroxylase accessory protein YqeC, partial [Firmicutes bacterium]|nr:putative selenium-dependent hydroxylase accessory protein YqeC [Bacillota bacterium]